MHGFPVQTSGRTVMRVNFMSLQAYAPYVTTVRVRQPRRGTRVFSFSARAVSMASPAAPGPLLSRLPGLRVDDVPLSVVWLLHVSVGHAPLDLCVEDLPEGAAHGLGALSGQANRTCLEQLV